LGAFPIHVGKPVHKEAFLWDGFAALQDEDDTLTCSERQLHDIRLPL
jgi:hypothetical protein